MIGWISCKVELVWIQNGTEAAKPNLGMVHLAKLATQVTKKDTSTKR